MVFQWSLRDNKSLQVSRTLLSILADLNNDVMYHSHDMAMRETYIECP